jgi:hypothetical protein
MTCQRRLPSRFRVPFVVTVAAAAYQAAFSLGCGGQVDSDNTGSHAANNQGGSSQSAGSGGNHQAGQGGGTNAGAGGQVSSNCPTTAPKAGSPCTFPDISCSFQGDPEKCKDLLFECTNLQWHVTITDHCASKQCPVNRPMNGMPCSLVSGSHCEYKNGDCCPADSATCLDGQWNVAFVSCNPPAPPPCPNEIPADMSDCKPATTCGYTVQTCSYELCPDGTAQVLASCNGVKWQLSKQSCAPSP